MSAPTLASIVTATLAAFPEVSYRDLFSMRRPRMAVRARQVAFFVAREDTGCSFPQIGRRFGRDHTTVMYGASVIANLIAGGDAIAARVAQVRRDAS